jgi:hypothetical protein
MFREIKMHNASKDVPNYVICYAISGRREEKDEERDKSLNTKYYNTIENKQIMPRATNRQESPTWKCWTLLEPTM